MNLSARILGVGLVGPGLAGWREARAILDGTAPYAPGPTVIPAPEALPATERRRAGKCVRLALGAGLAAAADAGLPARDLVAVFTSSTGDGENQHAICEALASDDRLISPTRFHNSVHNAPAGYWGIATGAMAAADSLAAFDASFAAGLLEAMGRVATAPAAPVLLVSYDAPYPEPLNATRPILDSFAVGLVLARTLSPALSQGRGSASSPSLGRGGASSPSLARESASSPSLGRGSVSSPSLGRGQGEGLVISIETTRDAPARMSSDSLERVRIGIPSARALPLLELIANAQAGRVVLDYLDDLALAVDLRP